MTALQLLLSLIIKAKSHLPSLSWPLHRHAITYHTTNLSCITITSLFNLGCITTTSRTPTLSCFNCSSNTSSSNTKSWKQRQDNKLMLDGIPI